jgi:hypothetical protein
VVGIGPCASSFLIEARSGPRCDQPVQGATNDFEHLLVADADARVVPGVGIQPLESPVRSTSRSKCRADTVASSESPCRKRRAAAERHAEQRCRPQGECRQPTAKTALRRLAAHPMGCRVTDTVATRSYETSQLRASIEGIPSRSPSDPGSQRWITDQGHSGAREKPTNCCREVLVRASCSSD